MTDIGIMPPNEDDTGDNFLLFTTIERDINLLEAEYVLGRVPQVAYEMSLAYLNKYKKLIEMYA